MHHLITQISGLSKTDVENKSLLNVLVCFLYFSADNFIKSIIILMFLKQMK